ncbi:MAG TPA: HNH endonuclease family protein, partial [Gemmata sp.]|nr:HNH endonuclease family protein [Gemmata sp.]
LNNGYDTKDTHPARALGQAKNNVEHILPQNRSSAWSHFKDDVARAYCKRIGNLTLLRPKDNTEVGNADFLKAKVPVFRESPYPLTQEVANETAWDETAIDARQKRLATMAVKIWSIKVK